MTQDKKLLFKPIQLQKVLHLLIINSYDLNNNTLFSQQIKDDNTILNNNIKDKDKIIEYLINSELLEKRNSSFYLKELFINAINELKKQIEKQKIFQTTNSKGISTIPLDFTSPNISVFQELITTYLGCTYEKDSKYYLDTKFKHTKSILSFYYLLNPDFAKQTCIGYIDNINLIKEDNREEIKFIEILGGNRLNGNSSNDFRKKIPHFLNFLAQHIMKAKGYTYIAELEVFKKNHLLDLEREKIKELVQKLLLDIKGIIDSNPNINLYGLVQQILNNSIQRNGNIFIIQYKNLKLEFEHMDGQTIIDAVVVNIEEEISEKDSEFEDISGKITSQIDQYFKRLIQVLVRQHPQEDAIPSLSVLKELTGLGFMFKKEEREEQIEEIIQILSDNYEIDVEEIDYNIGDKGASVKALRIVSPAVDDNQIPELTQAMIEEVNTKILEIFKFENTNTLQFYKLQEYVLTNIKYLSPQYLNIILQEGFRKRLYELQKDNNNQDIIVLIKGNLPKLTKEIIDGTNDSIVELLKKQETKTLLLYEVKRYLWNNSQFINDEYLETILQKGIEEELYDIGKDTNNQNIVIFKSETRKKPEPLVLEQSQRVYPPLSDEQIELFSNIISRIVLESNHILSIDEVKQELQLRNITLRDNEFEKIVEKAVAEHKINYNQDSRGVYHLYLNNSQKVFASSIQIPQQYIRRDNVEPKVEDFQRNRPVRDEVFYEYEEEIQKEKKSISTSTIIVGAASIGFLGAALYSYSDELINSIQEFFNSPTPNNIVDTVIQPPPVQPTIDVHTVVQGDNLWNIAHSYLGTGATNAQILELTNNLTQINSLTNPDLIHPGDQIRVPQELVEKIRNL